MDSMPLLGAAQLRPLRGPFELDAGPLIHPVVLVLIMLLAAAAAFFIFRRSRRWRLAGPAAVAERELVRLLGLRLAEQGRLKEHYALLAAWAVYYLAAYWGGLGPGLGE